MGPKPSAPTFGAFGHNKIRTEEIDDDDDDDNAGACDGERPHGDRGGPIADSAFQSFTLPAQTYDEAPAKPNPPALQLQLSESMQMPTKLSTFGGFARKVRKTFRIEPTSQREDT